MLLAPIVWILTAVIAYLFAAKTWWFPPPINAHGIAYDEQFMRTLIVTGVIFVLAQFALGWVDRKSTRLNSSHLGISYAVFCLKKKNKRLANVIKHCCVFRGRNRRFVRQ